jgi:MFS superfamily sulfate permease-like transporter
VTIKLLGNRRIPPAPLLIALGAAYGLFVKLNGMHLGPVVGIQLPHLHVPAWHDVATGFLILTLPQLPLSLGNSILATRQVAADLFPQRPLTVRKISFTYSLMNLINPFFGGVPTCHGSSGIAGHHAFGGRTGGSVVLYGLLYLAMGLLFGGGFGVAVQLFPKPVLGVILLFEAVALMKLVGDMFASPADASIVVLVGLMAFGLPYGYVVGLVVGTLLAYAFRRQLSGLAYREPVPSAERAD